MVSSNHSHYYWSTWSYYYYYYCASELSTRRLCLCGSAYNATPRYLAGWLVCAGPFRARMVTRQQLRSTASGNLLVRRTRTDRHRSAQLRRQWTTNMEQSASWTQNTRYDSLLLQTSSQGPPVSAVVYAAASRWAQHRWSGTVLTIASSAPFTNIQTYLLICCCCCCCCCCCYLLLTYLLTYYYYYYDYYETG